MPAAVAPSARQAGYIEHSCPSLSSVEHWNSADNDRQTATAGLLIVPIGHRVSDRRWAGQSRALRDFVKRCNTLLWRWRTGHALSAGGRGLTLAQRPAGHRSGLSDPDPVALEGPAADGFAVDA